MRRKIHLKFWIIILHIVGLSWTSSAQLLVEKDTLYGNEWIKYNQTYYRIAIAENAMYRISGSQLIQSGINLPAIAGSDYQLFRNGKEIPIYVSSTSSPLGSNDYIEFYGSKNGAEFDTHLYANPAKEQLNTKYSLFTDTSSYYLTWSSGGNPLRYKSITNDLSNLPGKETHYLASETQVFSQEHSKKYIFQSTDKIYDSRFDRGEGFFSGFEPNRDLKFSPAGFVSGSVDCRCIVRSVCRKDDTDVSFRWNSLNLATFKRSWYQLEEDTFILSNNLLNSGSTLKIVGEVGIAFATLQYPRNFDFAGQPYAELEIAASSTGKYLELSNFGTGGKSPIVYDITNGTRLVATISTNGVVQIFLPASTENRTIIINADNGLRTINNLTLQVFQDFKANPNIDYLIISHKKLRNDGTGKDWVQAYADYRNSAAGGNYRVAIVDIDDIYHQFGYGNLRSPLCIRNFAHYLRTAFPSLPYFFLLGEGREYATSRSATDLADPTNESFHIPTWGAPGSDNLLVGASKTNSYPILPIGRLAVTNTDDIKVYLTKMIDAENQKNNPQTITDRAWMKNIIHLGGGGPQEQGIIKNYINELKDVVEKTKYGPTVNSYFKTSTDPIQISQSDQILQRINDGVSVITFYGHAAIGTFDFSIDNLGSYKNKNKYPMIMSLGCYSGNIHNNIRGIGKRFVFEKDAGALLFGATSGQGYVYPLYQLCRNFYQALGDSLYGKPIGDQLQYALRKSDNNNSFDSYILTQQFTLLGDPAMRLYPAEGPDVVIDNASVGFSPNVITTQKDSFSVSFSVQNLGIKTADSIQIELIREFPDGSKSTPHNLRIATPSYASSQTVTLPVEGKKASGLNKLYIKADAKNELAERPAPAAEVNNELTGASGPGTTFYVVDNSATPLFPQEFAIVNKPKVTLKASTGNPLANLQKYIMEVDTTELFNSPLRRRQEITQTGGVLQWQPNIPMFDEKVYYWRVSTDSVIPSIGYTWSNSSFVYLPNSSEGWNQSHYYQFLKNDFKQMELRDDRKFEFGKEVFTVRIQNKLYDPGNEPMWFYNGSPTTIHPWDLLPNSIKQGIAVVTMDSIDSNTSFNSPSGDYGSIGTGNPTRFFVFSVDKAGRKSFMDYVKNIVPTRTNVNIFTVLVDTSANLQVSDWVGDSIGNSGVNIFNLLESYGATEIRTLLQVGSVPYCFAFRKDIGKINELVGNQKNDIINMVQEYSRRLRNGKIVSEVIGPAKSWTGLQLSTSEITDQDTFLINIYGFDTTGNRKLLLQNIKSSTSIDFDPDLFPNIQLEVYSSDQSANRTSAQLEHWRVLYEPLPDAAIAPNLQYSFYKDTIQQGDQLKLQYTIQNINEKLMDSLLVKYTVVDKQNKESSTYKRLAALLPDKTLEPSFTFDTRQLSGEQQLTVEINPNQDQKEWSSLNNFLVKPFFVKVDKTNPLLDVTFDGQHILNGDIITPTPTIVGVLRDENPYLKLTDTVSFKVLLKHPEDNDVVQIPFDGTVLRFFPSTGSPNKAYFEYRPTLLKDGTYQLIVQAKDLSNNISGALDYKVNFEIVSKQAISNFMNYPNPFTTSTRFAYTLTGAEPPAAIRIQIMTVSGTIVREITDRELGPLKIGRHLTEYAWDGTDQFGDRLANGVYLYRVTVQKSNGAPFEPINNSADKFFENGFGKMVILR